MKAWIERALNVYPGDLGRGALLCACLFLVIASNVIGKVAGAALFLSRFPAKQLAVVDIVSAIAVALVIGSYALIARRTSIAKLIAATLCFFASNCVIFWMFAGKYEQARWVYPVFYAWARIMGVLAPAQIWTLANCILSTREAKRVFGIVGSGAIVGAIFAGYISKVLVKALGTESLLLVMAGFLALCAGLVLITWHQGQKQLKDRPANSATQEGAEAAVSGSSLFLIRNSPYLRSIATVICISSFLTTLAAWQFMAIAQQYLHTKDALAVYFGGFSFYTGIVSLIFQLLFTTRFVRRFGIGTSLVLLPTTIMFGSLGLLIFGSLTAAVFLRGGDQILRYSIDRSTTELLYLPIPARIKLRVKWFIDTVVWRAGDCAAGIAVLIFASAFALPPRQLSWVALLFVGAWLYAVSRARHQYVLTLRQNISQHKLEAEQIESVVLDRSTTDVLAGSIGTSDPQQILYALDLLQVDKHAVHPAVRTLLQHPAPEVRSKAIAILSNAGDKSSRAEIEKLLHDPDLNVRSDALLYLSHNAHVDPLSLITDVAQYEDFAVSSAVIGFLGRPGEAQQLDVAKTILTRMLANAGPGHERTRVEIARLLGELPDSFDPLLPQLIDDSNSAVAIQAIRSVAKLRKASLIPDLLARLAHPQLAREPAKALAIFGDSALPHLRQCLGDDRVRIDIRREIPHVLATIGTPGAERVLMENLLQADSALRFNVIRGLNKVHTVSAVLPDDVAMIESLLAAEIVGHYRSYQILHALGESEGFDGAALAESMKQELERIFRLLALLHPSLELHAAYMSLQSDSVAVSDNALEFLENVLRPQLRETLLPLLDRRYTVEQKARTANRFVRTEIADREQAIAALVSSEDPWLRSCGAYAIGTLGITGLERELAVCLSDPDPLLREVARAAKERLSKNATAGT